MGKGGKGKGKAKYHDEEDGEMKTTIMLRGLPAKIDAASLLEHLDDAGYKGAYDFFYLPVDFHTRSNRGYAFINFREQEEAKRCIEHFSGFKDWSSKVGSSKACATGLANLQGKTANIKKHKRSSIVAMDMPDDCKPMLFDEDGKVIPTDEVIGNATTGKDWGGDGEEWPEEEWPEAEVEWKEWDWPEDSWNGWHEGGSTSWKESKQWTDWQDKDSRSWAAGSSAAATAGGGSWSSWSWHDRSGKGGGNPSWWAKSTDYTGNQAGGQYQERTWHHGEAEADPRASSPSTSSADAWAEVAASAELTSQLVKEVDEAQAASAAASQPAEAQPEEEPTAKQEQKGAPLFARSDVTPLKEAPAPSAELAAWLEAKKDKAPYKCVGCGMTFLKWAMCLDHIRQNQPCFAVACRGEKDFDVDELQERCRRKLVA